MKFEDSINALNEGLLDRVANKAAGVGGAIKGVGDRLAGSAIGALGGATNNQAAVQAGQAQKQRGKSSGVLAQINNYKAKAQQKINKLSEDIFNDLKKLGIDIKLNPNAANGFTGQLNKGFDDLINNINAQNAAGTTPVASPASPAATKLVSKPPAPAAAPAPSTAPVAATSTPAPIMAASTKTALDKGAAPVTATAPAPAMSDEQIVSDLNTKKADSYKDNNSLIMMAKQRAGETGVGSKTGAPKDGVEVLKQNLDASDPIAKAKDALAKQYNIDANKLVELMGKVYTESKGITRACPSFKDLMNSL